MAALLFVFLSYLNSPVLGGLLGVPLDLSGWAPLKFAGNLAVSAGIFLVASLYLFLLWLPGKSVWRWLGGGEGGVAGGCFALGCGLAVFSLFLFGAGLPGLFYLRAAWVPLALFALVSRPRAALTGLWGEVRRVDWRKAGYGLPLLPAIPWIATAPLLPPTNIDTLSAHLGLPALWGMCHRIFSVPGNPHFSYPMGFERLSAFFLGLGLEGGVPSFHMILLAISGLAYSAALKKAGCRLAGVGGWLVFSCGYFLSLAWEGHPDAVLVFAAALGVLALAEGSVPGMGAVCAVAAMCKYTGLSMAAAFLSAGLLLGKGTERNLRFVLGGGVICAVSASCWMARNWLETGNPVYPFLRGLFPSLNWNAWNSAVLWGCMKDASINAGSFPDEALRELPQVLWKAVKNVWFSPLTCLFCLLPLGFMRGLPRLARVVAVQGVIFAIMWMFPVPKFGRYLMPELLMPLAIFLFVLGDSGAGRSLFLALMVFLGGASFVSGVRGNALPPEKVLVGAADRNAYGRAAIGSFRDAVGWVNAHRPSRGRALIIGGSSGYGLSLPWLWADDASVPAFLLATGAGTDEGRIWTGLRQKGVSIVLYNPVSALHRSRWSSGYALSDKWMSEYAKMWRDRMALARAPERFDGTGGWYVYGLRSPSGSRGNAPRPWVPGLERILYDEDTFARGDADPKVLALQQAVMGDFGVAHYQKALQLVFRDGVGRRAVEECHEAVRRGMKVPWIYENLAVMLFSLGRLDEARADAVEALRLFPQEGKAKWLIFQIDKRVRQGP